MGGILILNGSLGHVSGNTHALLAAIETRFSVPTARLDLTLATEIESLRPRCQQAEGFVFATGTYWDGWGSPLQRFLEQTTPWEGSEVWLGKPAGVIVTQHGYGGKGVLSRLQGVLVSLGLWIPPMSGMVYSLAAQEAGHHGWQDDFWGEEDLDVLAHNLEQSLQVKLAWKPWPVDRQDPARLWVDLDV